MPSPVPAPPFAVADWLPWAVAGAAAVLAAATAAAGQAAAEWRRRRDRRVRADRAAADWGASLAQARSVIDSARVRMHAQLDALGELTRDGQVSGADPAAALRRLAEVVARTLDVDRVGVWELDPAGEALRCTDQFERAANRHSAGAGLRAADYPTYFAALGFTRVVAAADAAADPQTREFAASYLRPLGIGAVLAAPVVLAAGRVHGVLCAEHVGPARDWPPDEQTFAVAAANLAALVLQDARRREAEAQLRRNEERFRVLVEHAFEAVTCYDAAGRVTYVSPSNTRVTGYAPAEVVGRDGLAQILPDDLPRVRAEFAALAADPGRTVTTRARFVHKDGAVRWAEGTARNLLADPAVGAVVLNWRDVTDARRLADLMEQTHRAARVGGWELDLRTNHLTWTAETYRLHDTSPAEYTPAVETAVGFYAPEHRPVIAAAVARAAATGEGWNLELELVTARGRRIWVNAVGRVGVEDGRPVKLLGSFQDVTDRKRVELALQRANDELEARVRDRTAELEAVNARLREAQAIAGIGSFAWTAATDGLVWSDELYRIYGVTPGTFTPGLAGYLGTIHPDHLDQVKAAVGRVLAGGGEFAHDYRLVRPDGAVRWVHARGRAVPGPGGTVAGVEGVCQDVTDRQAAEEHVRASLREKEALLKEVHHRVKNNLQIVISLLNLQADGTADPAVLGPLRESRDRVRSMALIHEALYRSGDLAAVDLAGYVESLCAQLVRSYAADPARVRLDLRVEPVALDLDRAIPAGLLLNELVANALKHAFPGDRAGTIAVTLAPGPGGLVALTVADDGVGLPPGADPWAGDTLGLQLVATLARQLDGTAELTGDAGVRVRVTFRA